MRECYCYWMLLRECCSSISPRPQYEKISEKKGIVKDQCIYLAPTFLQFILHGKKELFPLKRQIYIVAKFLTATFLFRCNGRKNKTRSLHSFLFPEHFSFLLSCPLGLVGEGISKGKIIIFVKNF